MNKAPKTKARKPRGKSRLELMEEDNPHDEFLDPLRFGVLSHGGAVSVSDPTMGMDLRETSVSAFFLRGIYHELRQIRIYLGRMKKDTHDINLSGSG